MAGPRKSEKQRLIISLNNKEPPHQQEALLFALFTYSLNVIGNV